jgi:hypothetical protein
MNLDIIVSQTGKCYSSFIYRNVVVRRDSGINKLFCRVRDLIKTLLTLTITWNVYEIILRLRFNLHVRFNWHLVLIEACATQSRWSSENNVCFYVLYKLWKENLSRILIIEFLGVAKNEFAFTNVSYESKTIAIEAYLRRRLGHSNWVILLLPLFPTLTLYTDASNLGWGAYLEGSWALGLWSPLQQKEHINL